MEITKEALDNAMALMMSAVAEVISQRAKVACLEAENNEREKYLIGLEATNLDLRHKVEFSDERIMDLEASCRSIEGAYVASIEEKAELKAELKKRDELLTRIYRACETCQGYDDKVCRLIDAEEKQEPGRDEKGA